MPNVMGEKPKDAKRTPEEKQVSEVQEEPTGEQRDTSTEERSNEFDEKFQKMESELGRLRQELGDTRKQADEYKAYKLWYDQNAAKLQQASQQQVPQQEDTSQYDEKFFDKPTATVQEILQKTLSKYEMQRAYQDAYQAAPIAFAQAKMMYPDRFEGVDENMIQQIMYAPVQQGQMNPNVLKDPNLWAGAAWIAKGQQTGYKVTPPSPGQLPTSQTEAPSKARSGDDNEIPDIRGDALTEVFVEEAKKLGITKEDFLRDVEATREEVG